MTKYLKHTVAHNHVKVQGTSGFKVHRKRSL